ncbi:MULTISPECIES: YceI family protein [unclassified Streptomyces]|uniref:YceI family protein n=1 Tax=unclassified Streptomyces TaxID=2593676 RepID=UPI002F916469
MPRTTDDQPTTPAPGTYTIDAGRSTIAFTTRHVFGLGAVDGTFALASGQVHIAADPTQSSATAVVAADSFTTGSGSRDKVVRSPKYLDTAAHPHFTFASNAVQDTGAGYVLRGELTVKATAQPVELTVGQPEYRAEGIRFSATTRIDRYAFGITVDKGMTARYLNLSFDILAVPATGNTSGE